MDRNTTYAYANKLKKKKDIKTAKSNNNPVAVKSVEEMNSPKTEDLKITPKSENNSKYKNISITTIEPKGIAKNLVNEAEKYLGTPYKIGGTTKAGMDCSGLVMTIYKTQGIELPRISPDQYKYGKPLQMHEVQPGDLLFFSTPSRPNQIGHSAMCVAIEDGKIKFIHAASTGVRYDYLVPGYYLTHYKGACRVIDNSLSFSK